MQKKHYLCVFKSRNHTFFINNLLEEDKDIFQLVSTPCALQVGCGYSIRFFNKSSINLIEKMVRDNNLAFPKFYIVYKENGNIKYKEVKPNT